MGLRPFSGINFICSEKISAQSPWPSDAGFKRVAGYGDIGLACLINSLEKQESPDPEWIQWIRELLEFLVNGFRNLVKET